MYNYTLDCMIFTPGVTFYMTLDPEKLPKFCTAGLRINHPSSAGFLHSLGPNLPMYVAIMEPMWCHVTFLARLYASWGQVQILAPALSHEVPHTESSGGTRWWEVGDSVGLEQTGSPTEFGPRPKSSGEAGKSLQPPEWHRQVWVLKTSPMSAVCWRAE